MKIQSISPPTPSNLIILLLLILILFKQLARREHSFFLAPEQEAHTLGQSAVTLECLLHPLQCSQADSGQICQRRYERHQLRRLVCTGTRTSQRRSLFDILHRLSPIRNASLCLVLCIQDELAKLFAINPIDSSKNYKRRKVPPPNQTVSALATS